MCEAVYYMAVKLVRPLKKENEFALLESEMRTIRWICDVNVTDRFMYNELRERLGIDDIITVLQ